MKLPIIDQKPVFAGFFVGIYLVPKWNCFLLRRISLVLKYISSLLKHISLLLRYIS